MRTVRGLPFALAALAVPLACARLAGLDDVEVGAALEDDAFAISPASLTLTSSCDGAAAPQYLTLENRTRADLEYELQVPEGASFTLRDEADADARARTLHGTLRARGVVLAYLTALTSRAGTETGVVIARVGDRTKQVPVTVTVTGGALEITPTLIDFGEVRKDTASAPQTFELHNSGTEPVNVTGFEDESGGAGAGFAVGGGSIHLAPGQTTTASASFMAGPAGPPVTATMRPITQAPTCGELPALTLRGTRVNQDVTVNPVALSFGEVACGSNGGAAKPLTVSNYGSMPVSFTASAPPGSGFAVEPASGTVPGGSGGAPGTASIAVTLLPVGATFGEHTGAIEVTVSGDPPRTTTVAATVTNVGALLEIAPVTLAGFKPQDKRSFVVTNVGNRFVYLRHESSSGDFPVSPSESALFPGIPSWVRVKYTGSGGGRADAEITTTRIDTPGALPFPPSATLCAPAPVVKARPGD